MKTKLTEKWLREQSPCTDGLAFAALCKFDFAKIYDTCERGDWLFWLLRKSNNLDKPKSVELAIACSEHVIGLYEKKNLNDKRPRQAIEAASKWLKEPTEKNRIAAAAAAHAAAAAAADAADAAAYAAYAARLKERKWQADKIREIIPNPF